MDQPQTKRDWALYWATIGYHVFPLRPNDRRPIYEKGWALATTDAAKINEYWSANPDANIGCCPELAGYCVIDLDNKHGKSGSGEWELLCAINGEPPATRIHGTPSGGFHIWYKGSLPSKVSVYAPGVDTRGRGGYVAMPGSTIEGRPYTLAEDREPAPLPPWLEIQEREAEPTEDVDVDPEWAIEYARREIENDWIPHGREPELGTRNHTMYSRICRLYELGVPQEACVELMTEFMASAPPDGPHEIAETAERVYTRGTGQGAGFGSQLPPSDKGSAVWDGFELPKRPGRMWLSMTELEAARPLDYWDRHRLIPRYAEGSVGMVYGAGGAMKTQWLFAKAIELLQRPEASRPRVAYLAGEGGPTGIGARLRAIRRVLGVEAVDLRWFRVTQMPHLFKTEFEQFATDCEGEGWIPDIIIYDTLAAGKAGTQFEEDERLAAELTRTGMVGGLATKLKCVVIVVHHTGKDRHGSERGASGFRFNVDFTIKLTGNNEYAASHVEVWCQRMKDGRADFRVYYEMRPDPLERVPVPIECSETEWNWFTAEKDKAKGITPERVRSALSAVGGSGYANAKYAVDIAAYVFGGQPAGVTDEQYAKICHRIAARLDIMAEAEFPGLHMKLPDGKIRWFIPVSDAKTSAPEDPAQAG